MRLPRKLKKIAKARRSTALRLITLRARWDILNVQAQPLLNIPTPAAITAKAIRCASIAMCARQDFDHLKRKPLIEWTQLPKSDSLQRT